MGSLEQGKPAFGHVAGNVGRAVLFVPDVFTHRVIDGVVPASEVLIESIVDSRFVGKDRGARINQIAQPP